MGGIKQALCCQLLFQLLEGRIEVTHAVHGHGGAVQLVSAVSGKHGNLAHSDDLHAVFRPEPEPHGISLEHDALQRAAFILQREVMVARGVHLVVADLATDCHLGEQRVSIQAAADVFIQLGDGQNILCHIIPPWPGGPELLRPWRCR